MATATVTVRAADSINLGSYSVSGIFSLDSLNGTDGGISGLEASGVAYARDRGTLFFVGDEGTGVVEISKTGQTQSYMNFDWTGTGSTNHDAEGITYVGGGQFVVAEERLQNLYKFTYAASGTALLGNAPFVSVGPTIGNTGIEGVSYDPRNGNYVTAKQDNPVELRIFNSLSFSTTAGPDATPDKLFSGASSLFGLDSLSDVQTLAPIDALAGTGAADNLLLLSLDSRELIEITRGGEIKSSFDLSNILPDNAIEGVTVDENGVIYLVAEGTGGGAGLSQLIILTVPEPGTWSMMLLGLGIIGGWAFRRKTVRV